MIDYSLTRTAVAGVPAAHMRAVGDHDRGEAKKRALNRRYQLRSASITPCHAMSHHEAWPCFGDWSLFSSLRSVAPRLGCPHRRRPRLARSLPQVYPKAAYRDTIYSLYPIDVDQRPTTPPPSLHCLPDDMAVSTPCSPAEKNAYDAVELGHGPAEPTSPVFCGIQLKYIS
jgi:hypothetical protein